MEADSNRRSERYPDRGRSYSSRNKRRRQGIISVDLAIEGGKKYRLFWNDKTSIWDFSNAS
jgi:hypothetical protein